MLFTIFFFEVTLTSNDGNNLALYCIKIATGVITSHTTNSYVTIFSNMSSVFVRVSVVLKRTVVVDID